MVYPGDYGYEAIAHCMRGKKTAQYNGCTYRRVTVHGETVFRLVPQRSPRSANRLHRDFLDRNGHPIPELRDHYGYND